MRLIWKLLLVLVVIGLAAAGAGYFGIARVNQPYKGYSEAEVVRGNTARRRTGTYRSATGRRGRGSGCRDVSGRCVAQRPGARAEGRRISLRSADDAARSRGQDCPRRHPSAADHVSRRADDRRDGPGVRIRRAGQGQRLRTGGARPRRHSSCGPRGPGSGRVSVSGDVYGPSRYRRISSRDTDGRAVPPDVYACLAGRGESAGLERSRGGDAWHRWSRRRPRCRRNARSSQPSTSIARRVGDADAGRSDRHLCAAASRTVRRATFAATICSSTRPTTPIAMQGFHRGRLRRLERRRSKPSRQPAAVDYLYFVSQQRRLSRLCR